MNRQREEISDVQDPLIDLFYISFFLSRFLDPFDHFSETTTTTTTTTKVQEYLSLGYSILEQEQFPLQVRYILYRYIYQRIKMGDAKVEPR